MITYQRKAGTADVSVVIRIIDSTDGTPETGVVYNTSGIDLQYRREGATSTAITEATLSALSDAHSDGGFLHIGNGYYRLDLPDAACAVNATGVLVHGTVTGMVVIGCYIQLVTYDPFDSVRLGLTALPNAAADAAGGLAISDAGGLDLDAQFAKLGTPANTGGAATFAAILGDMANSPVVTRLGAGAAQATELAKVPKSDSNVSWNATALAAINAEVDTALNTAIPGSPTADSINERIVAIDAFGAPPTAAAIADAVLDEAVGTHTGLIAVALPNAAPGANGGLPTTNGTKVNQTVDLTAGQSITVTPAVTGSVVADGGNSATVFKTDLSSAVNDFWNRCLIRITSGALSGQVDKITDYDGTNKIITVQTGFTGTPAAGVTFAIENQ